MIRGAPLLFAPAASLLPDAGATPAHVAAGHSLAHCRNDALALRKSDPKGRARLMLAVLTSLQEP